MSDSDVQVFSRYDSENYGYGPLDIQVFDYDPVSETRSVHVLLARRGWVSFYAGFTADPGAGARYRIDRPGEVSVPGLSNEQILAAVDDILECGKLFDAFEPPDEDLDYGYG